MLLVPYTVLMDCLDIPIERTEHVHEEDAGLGISQKLHAASASKNRSNAMALLICGTVRWGYAD